MQELIEKYNIPTLFTTIEFEIPESPENVFKIGEKMPTQVGVIYGLSIYTDNVSATGNTQITTTEAANLYLQLKKGSSDFIDMQRMDDYLHIFAGVPTLPSIKYTRVRIPGRFSLDTSNIQNPTLIVSPAPPLKPKVINLNLFYIEQDIYVGLVRDKIIDDRFH